MAYFSIHRFAFINYSRRPPFSLKRPGRDKPGRGTGGGKVLPYGCSTITAKALGHERQISSNNNRNDD
jgi:hypothetical protein